MNGNSEPTQRCRDRRTPSPCERSSQAHPGGSRGRDRFEAVQALLRSRNSKVTPPRVVTGPILLTGLTITAGCRWHVPPQLFLVLTTGIIHDGEDFVQKYIETVRHFDSFDDAGDRNR
jgi:hypothetical protein